MDDPVDQSLSALTQYFVKDATMGETLQRVCTLVVDAVESAVMAGISMTVDGRVGTYIFSDPDVPEIDRAQYDTGDGPCVDAFRSGEVVLIRDVGEPGPYPEFRAVAARHNVSSVLSTPMNTNAETVGALNLYSDRVNGFSDDDRRLVAGLAKHAGYLLANAQAYWDAQSLSENLTEAMKFRSVIEQAKGIIIGATGMSENAAFQQLVRQSQHENVKVRDLAVEIVKRAQRRHPDRQGE